MIQENWSKIKLAKALFMEIKAVFNHVSKNKLFMRIINLGMDTDFVA